MEESAIESLGKGLKLARQARNLSLRDVEEVTGISNAYLSQLENEKVSKPSPHFLDKLARLYEISFEMVMQAAGYIQRKPQQSGPKTLAGAALFSQEDLTPEEEEELLRYLKYIRGKTGK